MVYLHMAREIVQSKCVCPKCKSNTLMLIELWRNHSIVWEQINGQFDRHEGSLEPGDAYKLEAKCKECGHQWTIRRALQISDIII